MSSSQFLAPPTFADGRMEEPQGQSLRKHRQTIVPKPRQRPNYGDLGTVPGQGDLPNVAQKDKDKIQSLVKKRLSSRPPARGAYDDGSDVPALPSNAQDYIDEANRYPLKPIDSHASHVSGGSDRNLYQQDPYAAAQFRGQQDPYAIAPTSSRDPYAGRAGVGGAGSQQHLDQYGARQPSGPRRPSERSVSSQSPKSGDDDQQQLLRKEFNAEMFISTKLGSANDVEISAFADKLTSLQSQLAADKKDALYSNYKTFLAVGSEIYTLGSELESLRKHLNDLHGITAAMNDDATQAIAASEQAKSAAPTGSATSSTAQLPLNDNSGRIQLQPPPRRVNSSANRHSMMMLDNIWAKELASLFRHVEGAQKYLPAVPGRHVVKESGGWYQLNAATWKPLQPVHFFLLNDHLLVATKKRTRQGDVQGASRNLVADQCFPLQEIQLMDISKAHHKGSDQATLCVKAGTISFVYRNDKPGSQLSLLADFRKCENELRSSGGLLRRDDGSRPSTPNTPTMRRDFSGSGDRRASIDITGRTRSLREIDELVNDLDVKIAYRQFNEAVEIISTRLHALKDTSVANTASAEKLAAMSTTAAATATITASGDKELADQVLKMKLQQRRQELIDILLLEIAQGYLSRSQAQENVQLLINLGANDVAKKTLFESRHDIIRKRIKEVEFHGDILNYITQVALIHFRMILSTVEIFNTSFTDTKSTSSLVEWVKKEVEDYVLLFARQLFNVEPTSDTYKACAEVTRRESTQLQRAGLDVSFMLTVIFEGTK